MKTLRPFFLIVAFVAIVGMACSVSGTATPAPVIVEPTTPPEPTATEMAAPPEPTATEATAPSEPTATEAASNTTTAQDYYLEEFNGDISNYSYFEFHEAFNKAKEDKSIVPTTKDGYLVFDLPKTDKWVYVTYDPYKYTDVRIDLKADNRGKNTNNVSLICRYSDEGWYELNIANSGLYEILAYITADNQYHTIYNGGSTEIHQGKDTNEYTFICNGNDLTAGINGVEVKTITDNKYKLRDGLVGFGVSSFNVTPILVEVDSFEISQP